MELTDDLNFEGCDLDEIVTEMKGGEGGDGALEWKFSQVFGERTAGEEVQEGFELNKCFEFVYGLAYC
ncbi:hypothetical protein Hdeb2414_s0819g00950381 [Helianthus debilis subsp. tardiflorus]